MYELVKQYHQQVDLFYYQNQRRLSRPKTSYFEVVIWCITFMFVVALLMLMNYYVDIQIYYEIPISVILYVVLLEFSLRFIGIKAIECYQHYAKEETRRNCLCVPSCSEYAIMCLKKYEFIYALLKIRKRLFVTCRRNDYIIDYP